MSQAFPAPLDDAQLAESWDTAWAALGRPAPTLAPVGLRQELEQAWGEAHRHYHDRRHLRECLALWSRWRGQAEHAGEVAAVTGWALWFHDAIYDLKRSDNELDSAAWAARSLNAAGVASEVAQRVHELVMATRHDAPVVGPDAELLVDIDLAILGSPPESFDGFEAYDQDVRKEWVPGFLNRRRRIAVPRSFADRARLYHCEPAVDLLGAQARINLAAAISRLTQ
jgi:predicted metal-dependent HD superfamily phosphohydrolase